jgi:ribosomal protein S27AE
MNEDLIKGTCEYCGATFLMEHTDNYDLCITCDSAEPLDFDDQA